MFIFMILFYSFIVIFMLAFFIIILFYSIFNHLMDIVRLFSLLEFRFLFWFIFIIQHYIMVLLTLLKLLKLGIIFIKFDIVLQTS
jgi:hypothetical protein